MSDNVRRGLVHGLTAAGLGFLAYPFVFVAPQVGTAGYDTWAYWTTTLPHPYTVPLGDLGSFPYSPPMALVFDLFGALPWWVYHFLWLCLGVATVLWLGGRWSPYLFAFPPVALELYHGNIHLLLAAAVALGFRHSSSWSFVLLTKPTAGIGLLWFVARREWRALAAPLLVTGAAAAVSLLIAPSLWAEWFAFMAHDPSGTPGGPSVPVPLPLRVAVGAAIIVWGARTDRPWTVAVGSTVALPVLWFAGLSVLIGAVPSLRQAIAARSRAPSGPGPVLPAGGYPATHAPGSAS